MAIALNSVSEMAYRLRQSRIAAIGFVLALAVCIWLIAMARAENWEDTRVIDLTSRSSLIGAGGRYIRVTGTLLPDKAYVTQANIGGVNLSGSRYVPLIIEGGTDPIFVADTNIPRPDARGRVTIVGKMQMGQGAQPPFFIEVGNPPNLTLQNLLSRIGMVAALALLGMWLLVWWIGRRDYALGAGGAAVPNAGDGALWFGSLGAEYGNAVVRHAPVTLKQVQGEIKLEAPAARPPWSVSIREVRRATPANIATVYGVLPGARIEFQDERGLLRKGAIAARDAATLEQLRSLFQHAPLKVSGQSG